MNISRGAVWTDLETLTINISQVILSGETFSDVSSEQRN